LKATLAVATFLVGAIISALVSVYLAPTLEQFASRTIGRWFRGREADLRGEWKSVYKYMSNGKHKTGVQLMQLTQVGRVVYGKNVGGTSPHRHAIQLRIDGLYLTGTWRNTAKSARHHGVFQVRLNAQGNRMEGRWLGFDGSANIQEGDWHWERTPS
jgi:hypothetical protein